MFFTNKIKSLFMFCFVIMFASSCQTVQENKIVFSEALLNNYKQEIKEEKINLNGQWLFSPISDIKEQKETNKVLPDIDFSQKINVPDNWYNQGYKNITTGVYKTSFQPDISLEGKKVKLSFEAIDYDCDIWLNGRFIKSHKGAFTPFFVDVSKTIIPGGKNTLIVKVRSPKEELENWYDNKKIIKGSLGHSDIKPGGAVSVLGRSGNTGGIIGDVYLQVKQKIFISDVKIFPKVYKNTQIAKTYFSIKVKNQTKKKQEAFVRIKIMPKNFKEVPTETKKGTLRPSQVYKVSLNKGENSFDFETPKQAVRLWSPYQFGKKSEYKPHLYKIVVSIIGKNKLLDKQESSVGYKDIYWDYDKKSFIVNGKKHFIRGANYQSNHWLGRSDKKRYEKDIKLLKDANINAVRLPSHVEKKAFYDLCDENGIFVFQGMPFQWGYSETLKVINSAEKQTKDIVKFLYNHPSIVAWGTINFPEYLNSKTKTEFGKNNLLEDRITQEIKLQDRHARLIYDSQFLYSKLLGWQEGSIADYAKKELSASVVYGASSLPVYEDTKRILGSNPKLPIGKKQIKKWEFLNFDRHATFKVANIKIADNLKSLIAQNQNYQAILVKYAVENMRKRRFSPVSAVFYKNFVDTWPSFGFGVLDFWRVEKKAYEALKNSYQPVLPYITYDKENFKIDFGVINDKYQLFDDVYYNIEISKDGQLQKMKSYRIGILPHSDLLVAVLEKQMQKSGIYHIKILINEPDGRKISENNYSVKIK